MYPFSEKIEHLNTIYTHQKNKTRTSKVGAISKAQKAQKTFFEKKLKILSNFFFEKPKKWTEWRAGAR